MTSKALQKAREYEVLQEKNIEKEKRPAFHLSPRVGWMNDPNGFSFYKGKYHMFYQYHPYQTVWGPMHWGHAVSEDMLHWEYVPGTLFPVLLFRVSQIKTNPLNTWLIVCVNLTEPTGCPDI